MTLLNRRLFALALFIFLSLTEGYGQRFYSVVFDKLPKDMQLYARDDNNLAEVPISGVIEIPGWDHMSVVTYRNNVRYGFAKSPINYGGKTSGSFDLKPKIKAEIADYSFEVFARKGADSVLIVRRNEIVAGDFYIISGQSNGAATVFGNGPGKYCRTIARLPSDTDASIGAGDTLWIQAAWSWPYVGAWGLELQKSIIDQDSIPTCVINGSLPGKKVSEFLGREEANPANPNSVYGLLLHRVNIAKPTRIRAFFWVHGEQEVFENIGNYADDYDKLFKFWLKDYPTVDQFIVVQSNILVLDNDVQNPVGGSVRDFLRRTKYLYPKTDNFTAIGVPGYDGVHYDRPGYEELGKRLYRFLRPTVYKSNDSDNVRSPDIQRAFYTTDKKDEITLTFDEGQILKWAADTTIKGQDGTPLVMSLKNLFYLNNDERNAHFSAGKVDGNRVILTLKEPSMATKISYLPSFIPKNLPLIVPFSYKIGLFTGPYLRNKRNLGAFSFYDVAVVSSLPAITLTTAKSDFSSVNISWTAVTGAVSYVLEKKSGTSGDFKTLKKFDAKTLLFEDKDVEMTSVYTYRIKAVSDKSESAYAQSVIDLSPILGTEPDPNDIFWKVYPNPVSNVLQMDFQKSVSGSLEIFNSKGQSYHATKLKLSRNLEMNISAWPVGTYVLRMKNDDGLEVSKTIVKQ